MESFLTREWAGAQKGEGEKWVDYYTRAMTSKNNVAGTLRRGLRCCSAAAIRF